MCLSLSVSFCVCLLMMMARRTCSCCFYAGPSPSALGVRTENVSLRERCVGAGVAGSRGGGLVTTPSGDSEGATVSLSLAGRLRSRGRASSPTQTASGRRRQTRAGAACWWVGQQPPAAPPCATLSCEERQGTEPGSDSPRGGRVAEAWTPRGWQQPRAPPARPLQGCSRFCRLLSRARVGA